MNWSRPSSLQWKLWHYRHSRRIQTNPSSHPVHKVNVAHSQSHTLWLTAWKRQEVEHSQWDESTLEVRRLPAWATVSMWSSGGCCPYLKNNNNQLPEKRSSRDLWLSPCVTKIRHILSMSGLYGEAKLCKKEKKMKLKSRKKKNSCQVLTVSDIWQKISQIPHTSERPGS